MIHYLIELAIWALLFYFIGCLFGWALRNVFGQRRAAAPAAQPTLAESPAERPKPAIAPAPVMAAAKVEPVAPPPPAPAPSSPIATAKMERPKGIASARGGRADDLQRISGVGPKNEAILHNLGIFHFDQMAAWTPEQVTWVDDHLRFNGRILREEWIRQAGLLAAGKEEEFTREFGTGGLKNKSGQTLSGSHTRKK